MNKLKKQFVTLSVDASIGNTFKDFCERAGMPVSRGTEMAIKRWMTEGCRKDIDMFKSVMGTGKHDLFKDMARDEVKSMISEIYRGE